MDSIRTTLKKHWVVIAVTGLLVVLIFEGRYFIITVQSYYSQGELRPVYHHQRPTEQQGTSTAKKETTTENAPSISSIQLWMTFDYINVVFNLPQNYLKDILGLSDSQYPNIRLDTYASRTNIDSQVLLKTVKQYIVVYNQTH